MAMWRRPKWQTIFLVLAVVVIGGHLFMGKLSPADGEPCLKALYGPRQRETSDDENARQDTHEYKADTSQRLVVLRPYPLEQPKGHNGPPPGAIKGPVVVMSQGGNREIPQEEGETGRRMRIPTGGDPSVFKLVSEMNSTIHVWPWPESESIAKICLKKNWHVLGPLPDASIIVSFHNNENIFNILHTLHAVVKRTPRKLLREIILIDDNTRKDEFLQLLEMHIETYFRSLVRLVRSNVDLGLIRARLNGIRSARGRVVVVMDSHVEPQEGWLEPILYEIVKNRRTLASPFLDWMQKPDRNWSYRHGASTWKTYFDWTFTFGFQAMSNEDVLAHTDVTKPVRSAVTVGTVWGMDKAWFEEVGAFDEGMLRWGGENLDLAVRVWLFGGQVVNIPCSHVAHLEKEGSRDYRNSWTDVIQKNYKRFAEVWLDDYKKYFYAHLPHVETFEAGDLSARLKIKSRALHNFTWFLDQVFPELGVPDVNVYAYGGLQSLAGGCFDTMYSMSPAMVDCNPALIATQGIFWNKQGLLRFPINIVTGHAFAEMGSVKVYEYTGYHNTGRASTWFHVKNGPIIETASGLCMAVVEHKSLVLSKCRATSSQYWRFRVYSQDYDQLATASLPAFKQYIPLLANSRTGVRVTVNVREFENNFLGRGPFEKLQPFEKLPHTV